MGDKDETAAIFEPELEILWCIKMLESIAFNEHASAHKAKAASKALKILKNKKAPLPKKRSIMHLSCAGYRKSMLKELEEAKKERPKVCVDVAPKASEGFIRKSIYVKKPTNFGSKEDTDENEKTDLSFCFNFPDPKGKERS